MRKDARIYVAGHQGMVGSALVRRLRALAYTNLLLRTHDELDLTRQSEVETFFGRERPEYVFLAAAKVGGILANSTYPADFIRQNLLIQTNVINAAHETGVNRLLFLGSSCIYPKQAPQPLKEKYLLTGPLEQTNRAYAIAKISGIEMCWAYNRQFGSRFLSAMPTNLFGPGDHYNLQNSHVIPALIRKMYDAKVNGSEEVVVWGSGTPRREFLYSDDAAEACVFLMTLCDDQFDQLTLNQDVPPVVNVGCGQDMTIRALAEIISELVGFGGQIVFDHSKPDGTPQKQLDTTLLSGLGWTPRIPLRDGLDEAYRDFLVHCEPTDEMRQRSTSLSREQK